MFTPVSFKKDFVPTSEQEYIKNLVSGGDNVAIEAFAGAAKTTTLEYIANSNTKKGLYLAFNRTVAEEARTKFPPHVQCCTFHSLAYNSMVKGTSYSKRLVGYYDYTEVQTFLQKEISFIPFEKQGIFVYNLVDLVKKYCQSNYTNIIIPLEEYFENKGKMELDNCSSLEIKESLVDLYSSCLKKLWKEYTSSSGKIKITHDIYLKMFCLENKQEDFDIIYLDEFQDTNPVRLDWFYNQKCQKVAVGDKYQSIYAWCGAINAFNSLPDNFKKAVLTTSFRFSQRIADNANICLRYMGEKNQILGVGKEKEIESKATLFRTNASMIGYLLEAEKEGKRILAYAEFEGSDGLFSKLYTANAMRFAFYNEGKLNIKYPNKQMLSYGGWGELSKSENPEAKVIVNLINTYSREGIHNVITRIKSILAKEDEVYDEVFVTGHKAKGREWDEVNLHDDFLPNEENFDSEEEMMKVFVQEQGLNLLYVALTRAKVQIIMGRDLQNFLENLQNV
jgi:superfamily I DNA/RNA helicase